MSTLRTKVEVLSVYINELAASVKRQRHIKTTANRNEEKQTILTGDQRQRKYIKNGQQLTRHADQPNVYCFFPTAHFLKTTLASRTVKHIWFFPPQKPTLKNQKSLPLPTHDNIVDIYTIRQCDFTIFDLLKIN